MNRRDRLELEITRKCPYNCIHCSTSGSMEYCDFLSDEKITQILNDSKDLFNKIILTGGEPLLKTPFFFDLVLSIIEQNNQNVEIYTSGCGLSTELLDVFQKYNNIKFCVSLEGNATTHDKIYRVNGSYLTAVNFIKKSIRCGFPIKLHFTVMKTNWFDIDHILEFIIENDIHELKLFKFVPQGRGQKNQKVLEPTINHIKYVKEKIIPFLTRINIDIGGNLFENGSCCSIDNKLSITNDGYALPCLGLIKYKDSFYNINKYDLLTILHKYDAYIKNEECLCDLVKQNKVILTELF